VVGLKVCVKLYDMHSQGPEGCEKYRDKEEEEGKSPSISIGGLAATVFLQIKGVKCVICLWSTGRCRRTRILNKMCPLEVAPCWVLNGHFIKASNVQRGSRKINHVPTIVECTGVVVFTTKVVLYNVFVKGSMRSAKQ
jgi:hypothetical protein